MRRLLAFTLLAALAAPAQKPETLVRKPAPHFVRTDLEGQQLDLSRYRGTVVLLNFWATWCAPCQIEMPRFVAWQRQYGPRGLQVIGVSMDDDSAPVLDLTRKRHINYPVVMGDAELGTQYGGVLGLPVTFLIDRQGLVVARYEGEKLLPQMKREMVRLLQQPDKTQKK